MYNGVSALKANQKGMDTIGNNIANVDTTGYKASSITFADQLSDTIKSPTAATSTTGGTNGQQIGLGVKIGSVDVNTSQGSLNSTGENTDLAVQGNGYFMLSDGMGHIGYTRDGHFAIDSSGNLVAAGSGKRVLGWQADASGKLDQTAPVNATSALSIPVGSLTSAKATTALKLTGNIDASAAIGATFTTNVSVFDSLGQQHQITVTVKRNADPQNPNLPGNTWSWTAAGDPALAAPGPVSGNTGSTDTVGAIKANESTTGPNGPATPAGAKGAATTPGAAGAKGAAATPGATGTAAAAGTTPANGSTASTEPIVNSGTIVFGSDGKALSTTGSIVLNPIGGAGKAQAIKVDLGSAQSLAGDTTFQSGGQDGYSAGTLQSFAVMKDGNINGMFTNGLTRTLGRISLATFNNAKGLERMGDNEFRTTSNSGSPVVSGANTNGAGAIEAGYLEQSNVDLSTELTNMIVQQRAYQANTKIVSAVDDLLESLITMKR